MNIKIAVIPNSFDASEPIPFCVGKITIQEVNEPDIFEEKFDLTLDYWSIEDYENQWREGIERIKTHNTSCLVASIQNPQKHPLLNWWTLYKKGLFVFVYNQLIVAESYETLIGNNQITPKTCYNFIQPQSGDITEDGLVISKWVVKL